MKTAQPLVWVVDFISHPTMAGFVFFNNSADPQGDTEKVRRIVAAELKDENPKIWGPFKAIADW